MQSEDELRSLCRRKSGELQLAQNVFPPICHREIGKTFVIRPSNLLRGRWGGIGCTTCAALSLAILGTGKSTAASDAPPALKVSPASDLHDGESISVSV